MMRKIRKPMNLLLSLLMAIGMFTAFPATSNAQEITVIIVTPTNDGEFIKTEANTFLGTSVIGAPSSDANNTAWTGNYVFYGSFNTPVTKFRVLAPSTTDYGGTTMLLDCDKTLGSNTYFGSTNTNNTWANSTLKTNMQTLLACTTVEKNAIIGSVKASGSAYSYTYTSSGQTVAENIAFVPLTGEKFFALSGDEVTNPSYGYTSNGTRIKTTGNYFYYLRSPRDYNNKHSVLSVGTNGGIGSRDPRGSSYGYASPAFNLDLNAVMFSSLLSGSGTGYGNEYKLTLKDTSLTVAAGNILKAGNNLIVPYTASSGANNVSVLITDKAWTESDARILQYGPLNGTKNDTGFITAGSGTFKLSSELPSSYHIYLLAENDNSTISTTNNYQYSKHRKTDYAGTPVEVNQSQIRVITHHDAVEPTCDTAGNVEYWQDDSTGNIYVFSEDGITLTNYVLPAGHVWDTENITWVWNDTVIPPTASAHVVCTRDNSHANDIEATVTFVETLSAPTCTETGESKYKATVTVDGEEYTNERVVTVPANGHTAADAVEETIAPTYDEDGHTDSVVYCSVCGAELSRQVISTTPKLPKTELTGARLIANPLVLAYDGEEQTVSAVLMFNGTRLVKDKDYVLTGNTATEPGTYTITAEGIGAYSGTCCATWRISNICFVTATVGGKTSITSYEEKTTARYTSTGNGAWYIDGVRRSTNNNLAFTVLRDCAVVWGLPGEEQQPAAVANAFVSERTVNGEKQKVTITATWAVPEGATVTQAGTARCYTTDGVPDKETVYSTGTKKISTLKTTNGTFEFGLNMGASSAVKSLCVVTYVQYTLNGQEGVAISDVAVSAPMNNE